MLRRGEGPGDQQYEEIVLTRSTFVFGGERYPGRFPSEVKQEEVKKKPQ